MLKENKQMHFYWIALNLHLRTTERICSISNIGSLFHVWIHNRLVKLFRVSNGDNFSDCMVYLAYTGLNVLFTVDYWIRLLSRSQWEFVQIPLKTWSNKPLVSKENGSQDYRHERTKKDKMFCFFLQIVSQNQFVY